MVKAVMMYRTEDGKSFDSEQAAVQHERRLLTEKRIMKVLLDGRIYSSSSLNDIVQVIINQQDEIKGALYFLNNG